MSALSLFIGVPLGLLSLVFSLRALVVLLVERRRLEEETKLLLVHKERLNQLRKEAP